MRTRTLIDVLRRQGAPGDPLARVTSVAELSALARRRLPRMAFDFVDGAAEDERSARANEEAFARTAIVPRVLAAPGGTPRLATTLLGAGVSLPVLLGPAGLVGVSHPDAEPAVARAAAAMGTRFVWPAMSSAPLSAAAAAGPALFQLYAMRDRRLTDAIVERARAAGCAALVLTADTPAAGLRERDLRNGFGVPPRVTSAGLRDALAHPRRWARWMRDAPEPSAAFGGFEELTPPAGSTWYEQIFDPELGWSELERLRERWERPLALKGVLHPDDARRAADCGVDAVIISNHGGRQLDGVPASLDALPAVAAALAGRGVQVLLDGGVRRGADVVRALALGADGVLVGRPWCWGLAAGGEAGVRRLLEILRDDLARTLTLAGLPGVDAVSRETVRVGRQRD